MKCPTCHKHELEIRKVQEKVSVGNGNYIIVYRCYSYCEKCGKVETWNENESGGRI